MDAKPIPAYLIFAKWFVKIRWIAASVLLILAIILNKLLNIHIQLVQFCSLSLFLLLLNYFYFLIFKRITRKNAKRTISSIKRFLHFQVILDLIILTLLIHFSGGVENPLIILYFFYMIVVSALFSLRLSYWYTAFILVLIGLMAFLESVSTIPHYHLNGFVGPELYYNTTFLYGAGSVYVVSLILLVGLTRLIVSKSLKVEETYLKTSKELEKKDKLKNEYVLRVTHDIKGHLAAIISCLEVVKNKKTGILNETQDEFVIRAYKRANMLVNFVKDLLNLTKKRLMQDVEFEEFSLRELIDKVASNTQLLAKEKSIVFKVVISKTVENIIGNKFTIEEVYSNLLFNSIKYTPENGKIELFIRDKSEHIITEITDSGIGIPAKEMSKVFEEFYRASNVPRDIKTGSGLGLSIVKQIIENHKGRICVQSEPGIWTKFTFLLPKNPMKTKAAISGYKDSIH